MNGPILFLVVVVVVLLVGAVLASLAFGASILLFRRFGRISGLDRLAERYPAPDTPGGDILRKQYIAVGSVYFRRSAEVGIGPGGLYLWVRPFLSKYQPLLIPWSELREPQPAILYWGRAVRLAVGDPAITSVVVKQALFDKIAPYLGVMQNAPESA